MFRTVMGACAVFAVVATTVGCGGVPNGAVATVDGDAIERETFDHWVAVFAKSGGRQDDKALREQALQLLISYRWVQGEAEDRDISVEDAEVRRSFEELKQGSFPNDADYRKFLTTSGQTEEDLIMRVRYDLLSGKIRDQVIDGKDEVTDERVAEYYEKNKTRFAQPERRDLRLAVTRTKARAEQAAAALAAGASWSEVASEYSIDRSTRSQDGKLAAVRKGDHPKALDDAIFDAAKSRVAGPVETPAGYYVFEVTKATPAAQQTLEQAKPQIEQLLAAEGQQDALDGYLKEFRRKWREKTECGEGFKTADCSNGPPERTASGRAR